MVRTLFASLQPMTEYTDTIFQDLSWQAALAHSAVVAAEDVRSAIRASRTATNAKAAANAAAMSAQSACTIGNFATLEEARAAQTRSSIAQSHAIHAAVVDHEAKAVKRRAALALAHDVKYWNVHRKGKLLQSCLAFARCQHQATRRAVDAWSTLRDGFIGTPLVPPPAYDRRTGLSPRQQLSSRLERPETDPDEVTATIFESPDNNGRSVIVASEHSLFSSPVMDSPQEVEVGESQLDVDLLSNRHDTDFESEKSAEFNEAEFCETGLILPFATASPIPEEQEENGDSVHHSGQCRTDTRGEEILSSSMQSLVDGLMSWGGGLDAVEDHMALPAGMAASIALEENDALAESNASLPF